VNWEDRQKNSAGGRECAFNPVYSCGYQPSTKAMGVFHSPERSTTTCYPHPADASQVHFLTLQESRTGHRAQGCFSSLSSTLPFYLQTFLDSSLRALLILLPSWISPLRHSSFLKFLEDLRTQEKRPPHLLRHLQPQWAHRVGHGGARGREGTAWVFYRT